MEQLEWLKAELVQRGARVHWEGGVSHNGSFPSLSDPPLSLSPPSFPPSQTQPTTLTSL